MKTFLLGVGCQKGGTTWLHDYLAKHPQCDMGFQKEYHIFDGLDLPDVKPFRRNTRRMIARIRADYGIKPGAQAAELPAEIKTSYDNALMRSSFYQDLNAYADYFQALAAPDHIRLVGDITPSYSGLSRERFAAIKTLLESRGFHVVVVFLMRDPVDRVYSSVRMELRNRAAQKKKITETPVETLLKRYGNANNQMRTRYDLTMAALDQVYAPEQIFYGFYETLFSQVELTRLTDFLGIDLQPAAFDQRVNASPLDQDMTPAAIQELRAFYEVTYRDCMNRFGGDFIRSIWPYA